MFYADVTLYMYKAFYVDTCFVFRKRLVSSTLKIRL